MNIWVQPIKQLFRSADSEEPISRGPISLITVTADSFVDKVPVEREVGVASGSSLCASSRPTCQPVDNFLIGKIHYTITHSTQSREEIRQSHSAAVSRRNFAMYLPPGFSAEDFIEKWQSLNYGAPDFMMHREEGSSTHTTKKFIAPHKAIKKLRNIARRGKNITDYESPQKQVVWGMPIDDVIEDAFADDESTDENQSKSTPFEQSRALIRYAWSIVRSQNDLLV
jgi:hypothetical protein